MIKRNIIVELKHSETLVNNMFALSTGEATKLDLGAVPELENITLDQSFSPVSVPKLIVGDFPSGELYDTNAFLAFDDELTESTYLVRGTVDEDKLPEFEKEAKRKRNIVDIYSDMTLEPMIVCPGSPPVGTDVDVERLLCTEKLHTSGMDGTGVLVAIVDTGVNIAYLNNNGKNPNFDSVRSWAWNPSAVTPGSAPVDHGTMCAYDVCISAPNCTILDIALLHPMTAPPGGTVMSGLLSDAIRAYSHLLSIMNAPRRPGDTRSLVVNNSWGMFHPSWDFPVGHPGNFSDNPNHPFNRIVVTLERAGADILFAAGNCGADCPDSRCAGVTTRAIYGANSSDSVLCVAGVDTTRTRVGYSAIGPGRLSDKKPDISGYTHFKGSGVYSADGGTSAACPVVSGVVAAIRSKRPFNPSDSSTSPASIRNLVTSTALDLGPTGYDYQHGYGVINSCLIHDKINDKPDICKRYPWICKPPFTNLCKQYPWLCKGDPPRIVVLCRRYPQLCRLLFGRTAISGAEMELMDPMFDAPAGITMLMTEVDLDLDAQISEEEKAFMLGYMVGKGKSQPNTLKSDGKPNQSIPCDQ